jgi:hypothetical protein
MTHITLNRTERRFSVPLSADALLSAAPLKRAISADSAEATGLIARLGIARIGCASARRLPSAAGASTNEDAAEPSWLPAAPRFVSTRAGAAHCSTGNAPGLAGTANAALAVYSESSLKFR